VESFCEFGIEPSGSIKCFGNTKLRRNYIFGSGTRNIEYRCFKKQTEGTVFCFTALMSHILGW
jgi:hypothetical protein